MLRVAVLIPALDEEAGLAQVLRELPRSGRVAAARETPFEVCEIVVVDNGSRDRTPDVARAGGATVVVEPRRGYGAACLAGLAWLRRDPPDVVVFLDADASDDPREIDGLLAPIVGGADLVVGSRVLGRLEPGALTPVQAFGNRLATRLLQLSFGVRFTDLGPFRAIRWPALESLGMRDRDYGWTVEMQARAARARLACIEVPVRYRRRRAGRSKVSGTLRGVWGAGTKILLTILRVRLSAPAPTRSEPTSPRS
jgi:glycosyltransferase involved in cell wall biosynthesis